MLSVFKSLPHDLPSVVEALVDVLSTRVMNVRKISKKQKAELFNGKVLQYLSNLLNKCALQVCSLSERVSRICFLCYKYVVL